MDINNNNLKIYTFRLDFSDPLDYLLCQYHELYQYYLNCKISNCAMNCLTIDDHSYEKRIPCRDDSYCHDGSYYLYDINNNKPNKINLSTMDINCKLYDKKPQVNKSDNNYKSFEITRSYEKNNIYIKQIYDDMTKKDEEFTTLRNAILNHKLIHILIDNFCKLHHIENIKVTLQDNSNGVKILETITIIIDETKEPKEFVFRKIKFYEHFSDFYRTKNNDVNYKIIQEPIGDGYCLIEEIEKVEKNT